MDNECTLLALASHGYSLETSTIKLSSELGLSQQSVSRKLIELEKKEWIGRDASPRGIKITITSDGQQVLKKRYMQLKAIVEGGFKISGKLVSSMGEGSYYLKQKQYQDQIEQKLGFRPYPGTLNIQTDEFPSSQPIEISGFRTKERTFGSLECYPVKIGSIQGAVAVPKRTHHSGILEIIAPISLRNNLKIKDGDTVTLEVIK